MKISVAVITYNHELYIEQALLSVIAQYNDNNRLYELEIIIADDGSKDNTLNIIKKIQQDNNSIDIKILTSERNGGLYKNLKRCLDATTGDYIAVLEGDDYYLSPFKLLKQMEFLEKNKDCVMCSHSYLEYNVKTDKFHTIDYQQNFIGNKYSFEELVVDINGLIFLHICIEKSIYIIYLTMYGSLKVQTTVLIYIWQYMVS